MAIPYVSAVARRFFGINVHALSRDMADYLVRRSLRDLARHIADYPTWPQVRQALGARGVDYSVGQIMNVWRAFRNFPKLRLSVLESRPDRLVRIAAHKTASWVESGNYLYIVGGERRIGEETFYQPFRYIVYSDKRMTPEELVESAQRGFTSQYVEKESVSYRGVMLIDAYHKENEAW